MGYIKNLPENFRRYFSAVFFSRQNLLRTFEKKTVLIVRFQTIHLLSGAPYKRSNSLRLAAVFHTNS